MNIQEKESMARRHDDGLLAVSLRFRAARQMTGLSQRDAADAAGVGVTAWNNAETGRNYPQLAAMRWMFRAHRVDFNFLIAGEFAQLPQDVQDRLFAQLAALAATHEADQAASSDTPPGVPAPTAA